VKKLIVVDDSRIRKTAFAAATRQLKKLERLEGRLKAFHEKDQRLFSDWFDLAFRDQRHKMDLLRGEYRELAEFYNWMNAMVGMEDISLPEAAARLREEENRYRKGSAKERRQIEELRRLREDYIRAQLDRGSAREDREEALRDEETEASGDADENYGRNEVTKALGRLSDDEIEDWCADPELAFLFLGDCLKSGVTTGDFKLFFRVWDLTHLKIQKRFAKDYERQYGGSLFGLLEEMRNAPEEAAVDPTETLKLLYRQLVRKLHPDIHGADTFSRDDWRRAMWQRVQVAYQEKNIMGLRRLFHLTLLRSQELSDLRVADLQISQKWIDEEIADTAKAIASLRKKPAWGFSRRKDLQPLERKLARQMEKDCMRLADQVYDLRSHIQFMERMAREQAGSKRAAHKKRNRRPRSSAGQMSFFD
jgi:hypothetical protein